MTQSNQAVFGTMPQEVRGYKGPPSLAITEHWNYDDHIMPWYDHLVDFFGGAFLCNAVPHLTRGLCGSPFPTPFASPPGRGLSPPWLNVIWGAFNLLAAYALLRYGQFSLDSWPAVIVTFAGALVIGLQLAVTFASVSKTS